MSAQYPFYRAAGSPHTLGVQHGEQARERILAHLEYMASTLEISREALRGRAMRFQPVFSLQK